MENKKIYWSDIYEIVDYLEQAHTEQDPRTVLFATLYGWIISIPNFADDPKKCNEKILERIQQTWCDERGG
ncbi:MAG: Fe-S cluster assembly protein IscX [Methylacidiphilales bacterium]|nr:Fe-S cluster assembly protein IscX [Candidatus Methylacidiphilales bacterium]